MLPPIRGTGIARTRVLERDYLPVSNATAQQFSFQWRVPAKLFLVPFGSSGCRAFVAQGIERPPPERKVVGSNPIEGTQQKLPSL